MHSSLRPGTNVALVVVWGAVLLAGMRGLDGVLWPCVALGAALGAGGGLLQRRALGEAAKELVHARTTMEVRSALAGSRWGRWYFRGFWVGIAAILGGSVLLLRERFWAGAVVGYASLALVRDVLTLPCLWALQAEGGGSSSQVGVAKLSSLQMGPIRHARLSEEQIHRIRRLQQTFCEVDPTPFEKWVEDFRRDMHPDREIRIYEEMAQAFTAYCSTRGLTLEAKRDVFQVVLMRSGAPDAEVLAGLKLTTLTLEDAREILSLYRAPAAPIRVAPIA
ncbi:MAG: hypothetical protein R3B70_23735 [Polyangiaceae bacterium]